MDIGLGVLVIEGTVAPGWEPVKKEFETNFSKRGEVGAAICMIQDGEVVVDLWGGEAAPGVPWREDTLTLTFSTTKGLVAVCFLLLAERGRLDYDAPVSQYWPEFGRNFGSTTVRTLLNHRAGTSILEQQVHLRDFHDLDSLAEVLAAQTPTWEPGQHQGYGGTVWGMYAGELFRRIAGETVGVFLRREIAEPLSADVWLGLPESEEHRVSRLITVGWRDRLLHQVPAMVQGTCDGRVFRNMLLFRKSDTWRAFSNPPDVGASGMQVFNDPAVRRPELPWCNIMATAKGVARVYAAAVAPLDGKRLVSDAAIQPLRARQSHADDDRVMCRPMGFSQGFLKESQNLFSPNLNSFGHPGTGGSVGWVDPDRKLAIGYLMNRLDWRIRSPRSIALCKAAYQSG